MSVGRRFPTLEDWLEWQQSLHPNVIDLGLGRVSKVLARTGWHAAAQPVVTVGGTNGKGSCVAMLDAVLRCGGYRVGTFTSPHLLDYRERIRLDGEPVAAATLVAAFERIADALGDDTLTFFEFSTLAALLIFEQAAPDALVLEVGMGGRLDAVNVVDADVAIVVSVALDHMEWLGPDVESIGREKAGIFRHARPAIFGSPDPPRSVVDAAQAVGARLRVRDRDFGARSRGADQWDYSDEYGELSGLPLPALEGRLQVDNAATSLAALRMLSDRLPLSRAAIERGLGSVVLPGRFQRVPGPDGIEWVLDVAHNPAAAAALADNLARHPAAGRTLAVCGMLDDKDVAAVAAVLRDRVALWYAATIDGPRGLSDTALAGRARSAGVEMLPSGPVPDAMRSARRDARPGDRILVFGSFHTVGPALGCV